MSQEPNYEDKARGVGELLKEAATAIKLHRYEDAEDFCVQALGVLDKASATEHPSKAMALEFMGDALNGMERYQDASSFYKRALDLSERIFSQENQVYISIVYKLARTYESLSLLDECEPYFKLADELAKRHLSPDHPLRETIAEGYAHLISRSKKRREKVVEIMGTFRSAKDRASDSEAEEVSVEIEGADSEGKDAAAKSEKHTAGGYKDLRQKSTLYESSAESMQMWITIAVLGVAGWLVFLGYQQFSKRVALAPQPVLSSETAAGSSATAEILNTYESLDGKRKLQISTGNQCLVEYGAVKIPARLYQGADAWKAGSGPQEKDAVKLNFVAMQDGLMDDAGNYLYDRTSPEIETRAAMQQVAKALRNAFLLRGSFPQNAEELGQAQITYRNPITGKTEPPIIQVYRGDQGWNPQNPEEKSTFETSFEAGNLWTNEPPFLPGSVHIFLMAGTPTDEPGATTNRPAVAIIKGADKNSAPIRLDKDKAYLIVLTPKAERTTSSSYPSGMPSDDSQGAVVTIRTGK